MTFTVKNLTFGFQLTNGNFGSGGGNQATLTGLRARAQIVSLGGSTSGTMAAEIYGMSQSMMNQLTDLGKNFSLYGQNKIMVQAGDDESGMSLVFQGSIFGAYMDGQAQPNVVFRVNAIADGFEWVNPAPPTSQKGRSDVATIMGQLAGKMGLTFENNGVNVKVMNPYLPGSARMQADVLAKMAGVSLIVEKGKLAIWPAGANRKSSGGPVLVSPATGMIGYPLFDSANVIVKKLFDPAIVFGGQIQVQSDITAACGVWNVTRLEYTLESQVPHGSFYQTMRGTPPAAGQTPAGPGN